MPNNDIVDLALGANITLHELARRFANSAREVGARGDHAVMAADAASGAWAPVLADLLDALDGVERAERTIERTREALGVPAAAPLIVDPDRALADEELAAQDDHIMDRLAILLADSITGDDLYRLGVEDPDAGPEPIEAEPELDCSDLGNPINYVRLTVGDRTYVAVLHAGDVPPR